MLIPSLSNGLDQMTYWVSFQLYSSHWFEFKKYNGEVALMSSKLIIAVLLSSHVFQDLEQKFSQQEHDALIVKNMKAELARFPKMERELRQLREENAYFRWKKGSVIERVILCSSVPATIALNALSNRSIRLWYGKL